MTQHRNEAGDRIIVARYRGTCRDCQNPIEIGQSISYGPNGARCMACVDGRDFTPPPVAPQRYGPTDAAGRPITPKAPKVAASRPQRPLRTYEDLFDD